MKDVRSGIPSTGALLAFEATARLGSVVRAAEELEISSPAISRHIGKLEGVLNARLFDRKGRGLTLTNCGRDYFVAVQSSIQSLRAAGNKLHAEYAPLTIGCTQGISVMILLPLYPRLQLLLGEETELRILNFESDMVSLLLPMGIDVIFEYSNSRTDENSVRLLAEEIVPVVSPSFMERFRGELAEHPAHWVGMPRLEATPIGAPWASWETWFGAHSHHYPEAPIERHENYLYLADAASKGQGIALGWNGFVKSYFETGRLIPVRDTWSRTKAGLYGVLTTTGQRNPSARRFLTELGDLARELRMGSEDLKSIRERWANRPPELTQHQTDALG
ncbi:MAG: LysR family transcriptional regulator [Rhodospirillaceae bacterium]|nr:LysR family transcriptional regulator [Rhodospirillaceae bacterium]